MANVNPESTDRLQIESQRMEERLRMLKQMMSVEKSQRETTEEGRHYWKSGKRGPLTTRKTNETNKIVKGKHFKALQVKVLTGKESDVSSSHRTIQCGQCDQYKASMVCVECNENYCNVCFAKFHHKGSLSKHHVRPLFKVKECSNTSSLRKDNVKSQDNDSQSLLVGSYDEQASAASFQEALNAWRESKNKDNTSTNEDTLLEHSVDTPVSSCGIQVTTGTSSSASRELDIQFTRSGTEITYFEKLLLKKVRANPHFFDSIKPLATRERRTSSPPLEDELEKGPIISPYNIFYTEKQQCHRKIEPSDDDSDIFFLPSTCSSQRSASVKIEELSNVQHEKVTDSTVKNSELPSSQCIRSAARNGSSSKTKKPKVTKKKETKKSKSKTENIVQTTTTSGVSDSALNTVIQQAWNDVSHHTVSTDNSLSSFFLTSVAKDKQMQEYDATLTATAQKEELNLKWNSSVLWEPDSSRHDIGLNISTSDLPPPATSNVHQPSSLSCYSSTDGSECDSNEEIDLNEVDEITEENNEADNSALEELACELASLCALSEVIKQTEEEEERIWSRMTMDELVHEFDQFQDQVRHDDN